MTKLRTEAYPAQTARWPAAGRHILAHHDDSSIVVYQAYRPSIGEAAARDGYFGGGGFSLGRMSWIKPNFLWMMYRCGWAQKADQSVVLAVWIPRAAFDQILAAAVPSGYDGDRYPDRAAWSTAVARSDVRLQWDPDHDPHGRPVVRRAIQLGRRGEMLARYARPWILHLEDISPTSTTSTPALRATASPPSRPRSSDPIPAYPTSAAAYAGGVQVDILTSGIWQTNSTILSRGGDCIVVDPAYFPRELDAIAGRVRELGRAAAVIFTHGHWDHVMGHTALPGAPVYVSGVLAEAVAAGDPRAAQYLADARDFDARWYVPRPEGHRWPAALRGVVESERTEIAGIGLRTLQLPGHSPDGLGLVAGEVLLVGDYLSPCEIPFVDDAPAYRATLMRLLALLPEVREVIPGHGPRLSAADAVAIARADLAYLDGLLAARDLDAALAVALPRAADVPGMADHHRENAGVALGRTVVEGDAVPG